MYGVLCWVRLHQAYKEEGGIRSPVVYWIYTIAIILECVGYSCFCLVFSARVEDDHDDLRDHTLGFQIFIVALCINDVRTIAYGLQTGWERMKMGLCFKVTMWVKLVGMIILSVIKLVIQTKATAKHNHSENHEHFMTPKIAHFFDKAWMFFALIFPIIVMILVICCKGDHLEVINLDLTHGHRGDSKQIIDTDIELENTVR